MLIYKFESISILSNNALYKMDNSCLLLTTRSILTLYCTETVLLIFLVLKLPRARTAVKLALNNNSTRNTKYVSLLNFM